MSPMTGPSRLRAQGIDALKDHHFDTAADLLSRYLDAIPDDAEAELALAAARSGQGKHAAALVIFDRHIEREPRSPALQFNRATALERLGRRADAVNAYERVLRLKPDHAKAQQRLQTLRGGPPRSVERVPPGIEDDIPTVIAVDDDGPWPPTKHRQIAKGRWIHPAWLAVLVLYGIILTAVAGYFVSAYAAGGIAGGMLISSLFLLAGLQTLYYGRRGSTKYPISLGYICAILGAVGLINTSAGAVIFLAGSSGIVKKNAPIVRSPEDVQAEMKARQIEFETRVQDSRAKSIDRAIEDIRTGDIGRIIAGCGTLTVSKLESRQAAVGSLLESLLTHTNFGVRMGSAQALGKWGTHDSIAKLEPLLQDRAVRSTAKRAIEEIQKREPSQPQKGTP